MSILYRILKSTIAVSFRLISLSPCNTRLVRFFLPSAFPFVFYLSFYLFSLFSSWRDVERTSPLSRRLPWSVNSRFFRSSFSSILSSRPLVPSICPSLLARLFLVFILFAPSFYAAARWFPRGVDNIFFDCFFFFFSINPTLFTSAHPPQPNRATRRSFVYLDFALSQPTIVVGRSLVRFIPLFSKAKSVALRLRSIDDDAPKQFRFALLRAA